MYIYDLHYLLAIYVWRKEEIGAIGVTNITLIINKFIFARNS